MYLCAMRDSTEGDAYAASGFTYGSADAALQQARNQRGLSRFVFHRLLKYSCDAA
jgi:hypothetical protein